jgi:hypothetical protein
VLDAEAGNSDDSALVLEEGKLVALRLLGPDRGGELLAHQGWAKLMHDVEAAGHFGIGGG